MAALNLERIKRHEFDSGEIEGKSPPAVISPPAQPRAAAPARDAQIRTHALPGRIYKMLTFCYLGILIAFWLTFQGDGEALFMVAISGFYLAAYVGAPFILSRVKHIDPPSAESFGDFLSKPFETWTGSVSGREAMIRFCPFRPRYSSARS
ncbi:MAG: hypothetical protein R3C42_08965 [Parvularculaceae bacterium]